MAVPVKTVCRVTSLHIKADLFSIAVGAALMGVAGSSFFIRPHKDRVVIRQILIDQLFPDKSSQHLPVQLAGSQQITKHPPHGTAGGWKYKFFRRIIPRFRNRERSLPLFTGQQFHGLIEGQMIVPAYKAEGVSSLIRRMVKPLVSTDSYAVVTLQPVIPTRTDQFFSLTSEQFLQIHLIGLVDLLPGVFSVIENSSHTISPFYRISGPPV